MEKCSHYDDQTGRCRSGWPTTSVFCKGIDVKWNDRMLPLCMLEEPHSKWLRDDGKPKGWPKGGDT